jgi:hypothetical protein
MRYMVIDDFKVKTPSGIKAFTSEQIIPINSDNATKLVNAGKVKPLMDIMTEQYEEFMQWLKGYELSADDIREKNPELLQNLHNEIEIMDTCFIKENLQGFTLTMDKVRSLYLKALNKNPFFNRGQRQVIIPTMRRL